MKFTHKNRGTLPSFTPPELPGYIWWSNHSLTVENLRDENAIAEKVARTFSIPIEAVVVLPFKTPCQDFASYVALEFEAEVQIKLEFIRMMLDMFNPTEGA